MSKILTILVIALFTGAAGCASTNPLTFNESVGIGYGVVQTIAQTTDQLVTSGKLTSTVGQKVIAVDQYFDAALAAAQTTYAANQANGENALGTALAALNAISACLATPANVPACLPATTGAGAP